MKDLNEKLDIFVTRCNLFERERSEQAYQSAKPAKSSTDSVETSSSLSTSSCSTPVPLPAAQSAIESLINLEVLRFVSGNKAPPSPAPPPPPQNIFTLPTGPSSYPEKDLTSMFDNLELKVGNRIEILKLEIKQMVESLLSSHLKTVRDLGGGVEVAPPTKPSVNEHDVPTPPKTAEHAPGDQFGGAEAMIRVSDYIGIEAPSSTSNDTTADVPSFPTPFAPNAIPGGNEATIRAPPAVIEVPSSTGGKEDSSSGSGTEVPSSLSEASPRATTSSLSSGATRKRKSLLGSPPIRTRIPGDILPLSSSFIQMFGRPTANLKSYKNKMKKKKKETVKRCSRNQHFTDNLVIISQESSSPPPSPASKNTPPASPTSPLEDSLINLDDDAITDNFGDPLHEETTGPRGDDLLSNLHEEAMSCKTPLQPSLN